MNTAFINIIGALIFLAIEPAELGIRFDHEAHFSKREISCTACHTSATSKFAEDKNTPTHKNCVECHAMEKSPDDCTVCHLDPAKPSGITLPERIIIFSHEAHMVSPLTDELCLSCHADVDKQRAPLNSTNYPSMRDAQACFRCHDGVTAPSRCTTCHPREDEVRPLFHEPGWKHEHKFSAELAGENCAPCHHSETFCSECHAGDNLVENIHELNFRYTHGLEANGKEYECQSCHESQTFCAVCHSAEADRPLSHIMAGWLLEHGEAAENDIESCAACHSTDSPTCARSGCHLDNDGIQGTDVSIHPGFIDDLGHGPWHDDPGFQCFSCHANTQSAGVGFCGYCHDAVD